MERRGKSGGGGTGPGKAKGEAGTIGEGSRVRIQKGVRLWRMCRSTNISTREGRAIRFVTYNICNGRNRGLESSLREVYQSNMDLGIFQDTKFTDVIYTHRSDGYSVIATDAPSRHRGGVAVFYWSAPYFALEAVQQFGTDMVGFQVAMGEWWWYIVGC